MGKNKCFILQNRYREMALEFIRFQSLFWLFVLLIVDKIDMGFMGGIYINICISAVKIWELKEFCGFDEVYYD